MDKKEVGYYGSNLFWPLVFFCIIVINLIYNIIDRNIQDNLIKKLIERLGGNAELNYEELKKQYPLVSEEFMRKTAEEQQIINNQEIQKLKKRAEKLIEKMEQESEEFNSKCNQIIERLEKKLSD